MRTRTLFDEAVMGKFRKGHGRAGRVVVHGRSIIDQASPAAQRSKA
jgi:hypothetical protein